jgi:hypothetical protein
VTGAKFQNFIGIVVRDKILCVIGGKIADEKIFIDSQPWKYAVMFGILVDGLSVSLACVLPSRQ